MNSKGKDNNISEIKVGVEEYYGVTGPMFLENSSEEEIHISQTVETFLQGISATQSRSELKYKGSVLIELEQICNNWVKEKALKKFSEFNAKNTFGKLFAFGSYRLGADSADADIDTLFVAPNFITRESFFDEFYNFLKAHEDTSEIISVPEAFVPVIKMKFMRIDIDLLFAKIDAKTVPKNCDLSKDGLHFMSRMDIKDIRSCNGVRVTDDILKLVLNKNTFKGALLIIKVWAKRRGIYSNAAGFLGGVSWAILVARICQLYPNKCVFTIVQALFKLFGEKWKWDKRTYVELRKEENHDELDEHQWVDSGKDMMIVLTPSYPRQNSTYNVTYSHRTFIIEQMIDAHKRCLAIFKKEKEPKYLFEPFNFFLTYARYFVVEYENENLSQYKSDGNIIDAKIRIFAQSLEKNMSITFVHLHAKSVEVYDGDSENKRYIRRWFIGFRVLPNIDTLSILPEISSFIKYLNINVNIVHVPRKNLVQYLDENESTKMREFYSNRNRESIESVKRNFFATHSHFIVVIYESQSKNIFTKESHVLDKNMSYFVNLLTNKSEIISVLQLPHIFDSVKDGQDEKPVLFIRKWILGFTMKIEVKCLDISSEISNFKNKVKINHEVEYTRKKNLGKYFDDYSTLVESKTTKRKTIEGQDFSVNNDVATKQLKL